MSIRFFLATYGVISTSKLKKRICWYVAEKYGKSIKNGLIIHK
jgi:hypothetical protein